MSTADTTGGRAATAIVRRHARLIPSGWNKGQPMCCVPSKIELSNPLLRLESQGSDGKVIFNTREAAEACARELLAAGFLPLRSYPCRRSKRGHYHLTTDQPALRATTNARKGRHGA